MFQIAKQLIEHFCLITIDIIGMGASSRPDDYAKHSMTPEQTNDFFNDYLERWRVAMGSQFFKNGQ